MKSKRARKVAGSDGIRSLALAWAKMHKRAMAIPLSSSARGIAAYCAAWRNEEDMRHALLIACIREPGRVRVSRSGAGAKKKGE